MQVLLSALLGISIGVSVALGTVYGTELAIVSFALFCIQSVLYSLDRYHLHKRREIEKEGRPSFSISLMSLVLFFCIALGILRVQFITEKNNFVCEKKCQFDATITSLPNIKNEYQIFTVAPLHHDDVYDVQVRVPLYPRYTVGDTVTLFGDVKIPEVKMPRYGEKFFDYENYLNLHNVGSVMLYPTISTSSHAEPISFTARLKRFQERCIDSVATYVSNPASSIATGMLFGALSMPQELIQTFRVTGLSHIVVLSGFNIAILISAVLLVVVVVPLFLRIIVAGIIVILFVLMVGAEVSIVRATIMSFISLTALALGRASDGRRALLLSLMVITLYEPRHLIYDVSLHLSFLATAGIVYMGDGIKKLLSGVSSRIYKEIITTTVAAYVVTLPYVLYTFGTMSVYALATNLIVLPLVPLMMLMTFCIVVTAPISTFLASLFGYGTSLLGGFIIATARMVESIPFSSLSVTLSFSHMIVLYGCIIGLFLFLTKKDTNETHVTKDGEIISKIISY